MKRLTWTPLSSEEHYEAHPPEGGRWITHPPHSGSCAIKYELAMAPGETGISLILTDLDRSAEVRAIPEYQRRRAKVSPQDMGSAWSVQSARDFIEFVRRGPDVTTDFRDHLERGGFTQSARTTNLRGDIDTWKHDLTKGMLSFSTVSGEKSAYLLYEPRNSRFFHYILKVHGCWPWHDGTGETLVFWPDGVDHIVKAAAFSVDYVLPFVKANRMQLLSGRFG